MSIWDGASALVTGAGSGIGLALAEAMVARGAQVWLADVRADAAQQAADRLGPQAHAAALDVRDAAAVQALVHAIAEQHGRLDFLFNNAGIGVGGVAEELTAAHYDRIIDINLRGVTNGVAAAYPLMVRQGRGHIINTASLAGLVPVPLLTPYAMTKHAVVGLSTSLRHEAALHGVRVSALCPAAVDTPLLDSSGPADLAPTWRPDARRYLTRLAGAPYPVDRLAADALRAIERNRALIVLPRTARLVALLQRLAPGLVRLRTHAVHTRTLRDR